VQEFTSVSWASGCRASSRDDSLLAELYIRIGRFMDGADLMGNASRCIDTAGREAEKVCVSRWLERRLGAKQRRWEYHGGLYDDPVIALVYLCCTLSLRHRGGN
jgi:hypothetical protein